MKKKGLALLLALTLVVVGVASGTLAWLTAKTDTVVNTFTTSGIEVELTETTGADYKMIPGYTIAKDPKATVKAGSEDCFLFVKLEKSANFDQYLEYTMADGWTELTGVEGVTGVYYRQVTNVTADATFEVLKDSKVTVKGGVTSEMMDAAETSKPTLKVTAYASQLYKSAGFEFTAAEAWANVNA